MTTNVILITAKQKQSYGRVLQKGVLKNFTKFLKKTCTGVRRQHAATLF